MNYILHKYSISADAGLTWTQQWLTEAEAKEEAKDKIVVFNVGTYDERYLTLQEIKDIYK